MSWNRIDNPPRKHLRKEPVQLPGDEDETWVYGVNVWLGADEFAHDVRRYYYRTSDAAGRAEHSDEIGQRDRVA